MINVLFTGRLATDPDMKTTANGTAVCTFRVAVTRRYKKDGEPAADFFTCVAWRKNAEYIAQYFTKGRMVAACGTMQNREWTDKNGVKRVTTEIIIDRAEPCDSRPRSDEEYPVVEVSDDSLPF